MSRSHPWQLSETLCERVELLVPQPTEKKQAGWSTQKRPADAGGHLVRVTHGHLVECASARTGASTTVYDRFRFWLERGFFHQMWVAGLSEFDELVGIVWEWQSLDGAMTKAPFGDAATVATPPTSASGGRSAAR